MAAYTGAGRAHAAWAPQLLASALRLHPCFEATWACSWLGSLSPWLLLWGCGGCCTRCYADQGAHAGPGAVDAGPGDAVLLVDQSYDLSRETLGGPAHTSKQECIVRHCLRVHANTTAALAVAAAGRRPGPPAEGKQVPTLCLQPPALRRIHT